MTNADLLQRRHALSRVADRVETVRARYAIQKNLRRVESALEAYQQTLRRLARDWEVDVSGGVPEDAPQKFREDVQTLLDEEVEEPPTRTVSLDVLEAEEEAGVDLSLQTIATLDFMIDDE